MEIVRVLRQGDVPAVLAGLPAPPGREPDGDAGDDEDDADGLAGGDRRALEPAEGRQCEDRGAGDHAERQPEPGHEFESGLVALPRRRGRVAERVPVHGGTSAFGWIYLWKSGIGLFAGIVGVIRPGANAGLREHTGPTFPGASRCFAAILGAMTGGRARESSVRTITTGVCPQCLRQVAFWFVPWNEFRAFVIVPTGVSRGELPKFEHPQGRG